MRLAFFSVIFILLSKSTFCQAGDIRLYEYLNPRKGSMTYNCTYDSYHANGLHDTITLKFLKFKVEKEKAYCLSRIYSSKVRSGYLASFINSALLYKGDTIYLAPLEEDSKLKLLKIKDFKYFIPPVLRTTDSVTISFKSGDIVLTAFKFETLMIDEKPLDNCLKITIIDKDKRSGEPYYATVWLNKAYGIVKWIRVTGRTEIRDLSK